jgi:hypothetical protein
MEQNIYIQQSESVKLPSHKQSNSLLEYGGKEAAILLAAALAIAIILGSVTKLVKTSLTQGHHKPEEQHKYRK